MKKKELTFSREKKMWESDNSSLYSILWKRVLSKIEIALQQ